MKAYEYLHDILNEWDTVFDPEGKQEYTEEQMIRFAELWAEKIRERNPVSEKDVMDDLDENED